MIRSSFINFELENPSRSLTMPLRFALVPMFAAIALQSEEMKEFDDAAMVSYNCVTEVRKAPCNEDEELEPLPCKEELMPAYNASARIPLKECNVASFSGSFIWWQAAQDDMDVAYRASSSITNSQGGTSWAGGKVIEMQTHFRPGFKLGVAYAFPYDDWEWFMDYTTLHMSNHVKVSKDPQGFLLASWISPILFEGNAATGLSAHWRLESDFVNIEVGRRFYAGKKLVLKPHIGVAGAFIDQRFRVNCETANFLQVYTKNKSDGRAVGPRFGVDANWYLTRNFSMVGKIGADMLYEHFELKMWQSASNDSTITAHSSNNFNTFRPEMDLYFGFNWEFYFANNGMGFALEGGYDAQVWWNQNMMRWYNDSSWLAHPTGNLYLQGFTLTAKLDF